MDPIIRHTPTVHHTTIVTLCNGTSWFNMGHQYRLFWQFTYPLWWKYVSNVIRISVGSTSPAYSPWRYQLRICNFASWSVSNSFIIPGVLYKCKSNRFVAFHANDVDITICCATQAVSNLAPILSPFLSMCHLKFSYCLQFSLVHKNFSRK